MGSDYDLLPFESYPSPERYPDRLWWMARLRGVSAVSPSHASLLEVGCATGTHLLAIAEQYLHMRVVGVDPSTAQINKAQADAIAVGRSDVTFFSEKLEALRDSLGTFDYIICHGVYSWIPHSEREVLLESLAHHLSENGVLYLSHNVLPGCNARSSIWKMIRAVDNSADDVHVRIERARDLLKLSEDRVVDAHRPYGMQLRDEISRNIARSDSFILHELLTPSADAEWLSETIEALRKNHLFYLGDAHPQKNHALHAERENLPLPENESVDVSEVAAQYFDILYPTSFRGSLFTPMPKKELRPPTADVLRECFVSSPLVAGEVNDSILTSLQMMPFYGPSEEVVEVKAPALKRVLFELSQLWPRAEALSSLFERASQISHVSPTEEGYLLHELLKLYFRNLLEVHSDKLPIASEVSDCPVVPPFRRLRACEEWTITLRGELYKTDALDRILIPLLDGSHSLEGCVALVVSALRSGALYMKGTDEEIPEAEVKDRVHEALQERFELYLERGMLLELGED